MSGRRRQIVDRIVRKRLRQLRYTGYGSGRDKLIGEPRRLRCHGLTRALVYSGDWDGFKTKHAELIRLREPTW